MLLSIGDNVQPGTYRPHSRFNRVLNFERAGCLVSVVDETIGPGPLNIILPLPPSAFHRATAHTPLKITATTVHLAGRRFHFTPRHRYHSTLDLAPADPQRLHRNLPTLADLLKTTAPPKSLAFLLDKRRLKNLQSPLDQAFAARIQTGVDQIFHGSLLDGVQLLKGCGHGLTPSGDDFLAGLLIGLNFLQKLRATNLQPLANAIFRAAQGDNIFSNTFLDLARRGLLSAPMKTLLQALVTGHRDAVLQAARRLFAIGATSGADLATGFYLTLTSEKATRSLPSRLALTTLWDSPATSVQPVSTPAR